jgi:flavin-binding protein dodecin
LRDSLDGFRREDYIDRRVIEGDLFPQPWSVVRRWCQVAGSVYKVVELIGTSTESWEEAARAAVEAAAQSLEDIRIAEVVKLDMRLNDNKVVEFRTKMMVSFKYHKELAD